MLVTVQCHFVLLQTGEQYFDEEQNHLHVPPLYLEPLNFSQYCYDATWTLVYALNQTITGKVCVCVCVGISDSPNRANLGVRVGVYL